MTIIWIDRSRVESNKSSGILLPPIKVKTDTGLRYASDVQIKGASRVVYAKDGGAKCGASVWIETDAEVEIVK